jgi:hypothetical protein
MSFTEQGLEPNLYVHFTFIGGFMIRSLFLIALASIFSMAVSAAEQTMPPKNPKVQVTQPPAPNATGEYGVVKFNPTDAKPFSNLTSEKDVLVKTSVAEVCPKKGCWMNVQGEKPGELVRVTFKDYGFFVPTELAGKEVALQGRYIKHIESVEEQKHLLKDAKRPQSEIDAVTMPKETLRFIATGVKDLSTKSK